jgi:hypothetical protein
MAATVPAGVKTLWFGECLLRAKARTARDKLSRAFVLRLRTRIGPDYS